MKSYILSQLLVILVAIAKLQAQEIDLKQYAIEASGTVLQVIPEQGILSLNTHGQYTLATMVDVPVQEVYQSYDPLANVGRGGIRREVRTVHHTKYIYKPVKFPEIIYIHVAPQGYYEGAQWGKWTIYEIGTYTYQGVDGASHTAKKYTVNPQEAFEYIRAKNSVAR
ncbi:MAG: hypothetical protein JO295_00690 [Verrucomicrobia bacterium]|nr:hypothetical protein [Verrucomicrobiota bacterium]